MGASKPCAPLLSTDCGSDVLNVTPCVQVIMTPLLTSCLIGTTVPVDGMGLFISTLQVGRPLSHARARLCLCRVCAI
jgi:hypothetical protein